MKITYLKLKNFAQIFSGMKRKTIEIDFSKTKNRIILLIGPNGSGKTALIAQLQPFAYQGSLDVRNGIGIIDKENGYKEIHIEVGNDLYVIKHHYIYSEKTGYTIKSHIFKNSIDLNSNGNQTSFKEIINLEFGLDMDFLKLLRLGSNVTNFIDLKSTDRKNFSKELLSDIDIYSKLYKKINDDIRFMKLSCKSIREKLQKHNISNMESFTSEIDDSITRLNNIKKLKTKLDSEVYEIQGYIKNVINVPPKDFLLELRTKRSELKSCEEYYNKLNSKLESYSNVISLTELQYKIDNNTSLLNFLKIELNNTYDQKDAKELSLKNTVSHVNHSGMHDRLIFLKEKREKLSKYKNFKPKFNKQDLLTALNLMHSIDNIHNTINTFDLKVVKEVTKLVLTNVNIEKFVSNKTKELDYTIHENTLNKMRLDIGSTENYLIMSVPSTCKNKKCAYYIKYNSGIIDNEEVDVVTINKTIDKCERKKEYYLSMLDVNKNIQHIELLIETNTDTIEKMPKDFFNFKEIIKNINNSHQVYDESEFTQYISVIEDFEEYNSVNIEIVDVQKEIDYFNLNKTTLDNAQNELIQLNVSISDKCKQIKALEIDGQILQNSLEKSKKYSALKDEFSELVEKKTRLEKDVSSMSEIWSKISTYMEKHTVNVEELTTVNSQLQKLEKELIDKEFKLRDYSNLKIELEEKDIQLEEIQVICDSLSSTKGLPLLFIQLYMEDIKLKVNELLNIAYDGELEITDFVISETEFTVPYKKNDLYVSDVRMCSQGEKSFISLAISFALLEKSLDKYNIMLLDEIDSTLDTKNRYKFISILEKQLDIIYSEQCFLITHNNMFDNYPVSILMTGDADIDNFKNIEILKIK